MNNRLSLVFWGIVFATFSHFSAYSQMIINVERSTAACEGQCNGTLVLKVEPGTVVPLIVRLKSGSPSQEVDVKPNIISEATFTGLCEGTKYFIEISSEHPAGCKTNTITYTVPKAPLSIATKEVKSPNFDNTSDGVIEIDVLGSIHGNYVIQWNNGPQTKRIENLPGGIYEVSVTDADLGCTLTKAFQLQPCHTDGPIDEGATSPDFEVKFSGKFPEENTPKDLTAFIRFDPTGLFQKLPPEYAAKWYIEGQLVGVGNTFSAPANFTGAILTLEVIDPCGRSKSYTNSIVNCKSSSSDFAKHFISKFDQPCGPNLEGGVHFEFDGSTDQGEEIQLDIIRDDSSVPIFSLSRNQFNTDGASYTAFVGGLESETEYRIIGFLGDNCPVNFTFTIPYKPPQRKFVEYKKGSFLCLYDEYCNGKLLEPPKNYREAAFIDFDKSKIKEAFEDGNFFHRCQGTILCRDGFSYREVDKRSGWALVSGLEWQRMLIQSGNGIQGIPDYDKAVTNPCAFFNVCSYDPSVASVGAFEPPLGAKFKGCQPGEGNCVICDCSVDVHKICVDNFVTPPPPLPNKPIVQLTINVETRSEDEKLLEICLQEEKSLLQMVDWHKRGELLKLWDGSKGDHLKYAGSNLENEIKKHTTKSPVPSFADIRCAKISFCKNNLNLGKIITTFSSDPDFPENYRCGVVANNSNGIAYCEIKSLRGANNFSADYFGHDLNGGNTMDQAFADNQSAIEKITFYCPNNNTGATGIGEITVNFKSPAKVLWNGDEISFLDDDQLELKQQQKLIEPLNDSILVNININDTLSNEQLLNFAYIRYKGVLHTEGILETNQGKAFLDFSYLDQQILSKKIFSNLRQYIEYWDTGQNLYSYDLTPNKEFGIIYEDTVGLLNTALASDQFLKLQNLAILDTNLVITGFAKGNLSLDSSIIGNIPTNSMFILELTRRGQINRFHLLEGIDTLQGAKFTEIQNGTVGLSVKYAASQPLLLNGNPVNTAHNHGVLFATSASDTFTLIKDIAVGSEVQVKQISLAKNASQFAFVLSSADSLNLSTQAIAAGNNLVIGTMSTTGFLKWGHQIPDSVLNTSKLALTHGDSTQVFLGLSFSDTLAFQDRVFYSQGDEDVLIMKFGLNGGLSFAKPYGSASKETVTHLFYESNLLVFGGDLQGNSPERVLGMFKITNHTNYFNRAYMAALLDTLDQAGEIAAVAVEQEGLKTIQTTQPKDRKANALDKELLINVYPNPFRNEFTLEVNARQTETLTLSLLDNLGKTIKQSAMPVNAGYNAQVINTVAFPSGIYFLHLKDATGRLIKTHRVVKL